MKGGCQVRDIGPLNARLGMSRERKQQVSWHVQYLFRRLVMAPNPNKTAGG
jgi:hypothetical protein